MDPPDTPPLVFAHQVIEQFAEHLFGDTKIDAQGLRVVRLVFRKLGGSWYQLCMGSPRDTDLLIQAVRAWGEAKTKSKIDKDSLPEARVCPRHPPNRITNKSRSSAKDSRRIGVA